MSTFIKPDYTSPDVSRNAFDHYFVKIDGEARIISVDSRDPSDNGVPFAVWHNRVMRYHLRDGVDGGEVAELFDNDSFVDLVETMLDGYSEHWDGNNHKGQLTEEAKEADEKIQRMVESIEPVWSVIHVSDWADRSDVMRELRSGVLVDDIVSSIEYSADENRIVLTGRVAEYVQNIAEELGEDQ